MEQPWGSSGWTESHTSGALTQPGATWKCPEAGHSRGRSQWWWERWAVTPDQPSPPGAGVFLGSPQGSPTEYMLASPFSQDHCAVAQGLSLAGAFSTQITAALLPPTPPLLPTPSSLPPEMQSLCSHATLGDGAPSQGLALGSAVSRVRAPPSPASAGSLRELLALSPPAASTEPGTQ